VLGGIGPVATVGASVARGRASRAAIAVTAVAVAAGVAAGSLIASYDQLVHSPGRYGAWWDVAVGQYSERSAVDEAVAKLRANPSVVNASGYLEQPSAVNVDGTRARLLALEQYVGRRGLVMARGRAPASASEVALGRATARHLHKSVGDHVNVVASGDTHRRMRVVGIVVVNDPVTADASAGDGAYVIPSVFKSLSGSGSVPQSIVIAVDPHRDRAAAIESVQRDFAGSIREVQPQVAARNLGRLRSVPWLIAALVGFLALATLVHALVTLLARNRGTLAVLAVLGFVRRQRRGVGLFASAWLVGIGALIGIPVGLVVGAAVWRAVASGVELPTPTVLAWRVAIVEVLGALALATVVAAAASKRPLRVTPGQQLRVD
jgi:ABC-type lipoprotein release transport system permease subunit